MRRASEATFFRYGKGHERNGEIKGINETRNEGNIAVEIERGLARQFEISVWKPKRPPEGR